MIDVSHPSKLDANLHSFPVAIDDLSPNAIEKQALALVKSLRKVCERAHFDKPFQTENAHNLPDLGHGLRFGT
jgi:hypothetical protein